jgi:tetratricopeptide (TPR) repeat protein
MSRFFNLEFGGQAEGPLDGRPAGPLARWPAVSRDAAHSVAQAQEAFEQADFESALRLHARALEFDPRHAGAWTGQVRALIELGDCAEASLWADKALEQFPNSPELLAAKAVALARSGDVEGAIAFSDSSIAESGNTPYVWLSRGDVLLARQASRRRSSWRHGTGSSPGWRRASGRITGSTPWP